MTCIPGHRIAIVIFLLLVYTTVRSQNKLQEEGNFEFFSAYTGICDINNNDCNDSGFRATFQDNCVETSWKVSHGTPEVCNNGGNYHVHLWSGDFNLTGTFDRGEGLFYNCNLEVGRYHELSLRLSSDARIDKVHLRYASGLQHKAANANIWNPVSSFYQVPTGLSSNRVIQVISNFNSNGSWQTVGPYGFVPTNSGSNIWVYTEDGSSSAGGSSPVDFLFLDDFNLESCPTSKVFSISSNLPRLTTTNVFISTSSNVTVQSGQNVTFQAGSHITLKPGFKANQGSIFAARIAPCNTTFCTGCTTCRSPGQSQAATEKNHHDESIIGDNPQLIEVYPNPTTGKFQVSSAAKDRIVKLSVFNASGIKIAEVDSRKQGALLVDLSDQPEGIFLIRIATEHGQTISRKVIFHNLN